MAAHPYGDTHLVTVLTKAADGLTEESAKKLLEGNKDFKLTKFTKKS